MRQHKIDTYKDGFSKVEFCIICGAEGETLQLDCVGIPSDPDQHELFSNQAEKDIDKGEEQF